MALPITTFYGILVWMAAGLFPEGWWIPFALFALSTYLIVELNNSNALIRIYSRMVSCSFIALWSMACFLFGDLKIAVIQTGVIACYSCLFHSYQNKSSGLTYVAALALGLASLIDIQLLFFVHGAPRSSGPSPLTGSWQPMPYTMVNSICSQILWSR